MFIGKRTAIALVAFLLPFSGGRAEDFRQTAKANIQKHQGEEGTPFRKALKQKLKERKGNGKKTPSVIAYDEPTLEEIPDGTGFGPGDCAEKKHCPVPGYVVKFNATTRFKYAGPDEVHDPGAGKPKSEWPAVQLKKKVQNPTTGEWEQVYNADGTEAYDDYTQAYKDQVTVDALAQGKIAWKTDPSDPNDPGLYEFGQEPQEEDVTEEITFTFKKNDQAQGKAFFRQLAQAMQQGDVSAEKAILMGFTYQGPNIDYTIGSKKRVCFIKCVTLWDIRAGFALDFGLGLRVPAFSRVYGPPQMVAGNTYTFSSEILTDGTKGDWGPPEFNAVGVNPYSDKGSKGGNEFVMYFEFFAGAKVNILGANVCPYCQYVEVNKDWSQSFATPFGPGTRFPLPTIDIPVKDFNYGIVSLVVGLYVTPNLFSTNISAVTNTGAEITHSAPGVPATFPVAACIQNEAPRPRYQTVSLDAYKYHFNQFTVTLGAWMNFSVAGYGVWNPRFDFLTLDLSSALGSLGIYLPDHKNCDFTFNCSYAPAVQQVAASSELLDQSPPSSSLALAATAGKNGWYVSDVAGTLSAVDNPVGCGAGVKETYWALDGGGLQTAGAFTLTSERKMVVSYGATDKDDNAEPALHTQSVWIDKTPPTLTGFRRTSPNVRNWYNANVTVHFDATDATSGVAFLTPDQTVTAEGLAQSVTGAAEDVAGLASTLTIGDINLDKTPPAIVIAAPSATGTYTNTDVVALGWGITDALSGVLTTGATLDGVTAVTDGTPIASGSAVNLVQLGGGNHDLVVTATDNADNVQTNTVTFLIDVDIYGFAAAVKYTCEQGWLDRGACKAFTAQVNVAVHGIEKGNTNAARGVLLAVNQELHARNGKGVNDLAFRLLYADVQYVLRRYGLIGA